MSTGLQVTIIGGGLAGLLAARVLREKHSVTILERSHATTEVGAAINIGPTGTRIIEQYGFDRARVGSLPVGLTRTWNKAGVNVHEQKTNPLKEYGADWLFQHRGDLRQEFLRLATAPSAELGIGGRPAKLRLGVKVTSVDVDSGVVETADGERIEADLVIAADGIKSFTRPFVVGEEAFTTARPSGLSAFRFTMATEEALKISPNLQALDRTKPACLEMVFSFDPTRRSCVMYPCRNFNLINFVCIVPDEILKSPTTESWQAPGDVSELVSCFEDFPRWMTSLLGHAEDIQLWQLRDQDPLPTYIKGRTILIGDAAHAMTPHQGQGATQAVEDAEAFALFNRSDVSGASVLAVLEDINMVRRKRASQIQENTRKSVEKRSAEEVYSFAKYNWTYPGIEEGVRRMKAGEILIQY